MRPLQAADAISSHVPVAPSHSRPSDLFGRHQQTPFAYVAVVERGKFRGFVAVCDIVRASSTRIFADLLDRAAAPRFAAGTPLTRVRQVLAAGPSDVGAVLDRRRRYLGAVLAGEVSRRLADDVPRAGRAQLRAVIDANPECIKLLDVDCRLVDVNPAGLRALGAASIDQVRGRSVLTYFPRELRKRFRACVDAALSGKRTGKNHPIGVFRRVAPDGQEHWTEQHFVNMTGRGVDGSDARVLVVARDITEQRRASEVLARSEREYRGLFENAQDAILLICPHTQRIVDVNQRACAMYRCGRADIVGAKLARIATVPPAERRSWLMRTVNEGSVQQVSRVQRRFDGTQMPVEINASIVEYRGKPTVLSINRDLTERKEIEAQLIKAARREALATLAGGIAHEFNSTLLAAGLHLYGLEGSPDVAPRAAKAAELIQQAQSLSAALLELFAGPEQPRRQVVDLAAWVGPCAQRLTGLLPPGVRVTVGLATKRCRAFADALSIEQVLRILLNNACDALDGHGNVSITLRRIKQRSASWAELRVADDGPGVPVENRVRVFEPFFTTRNRARRSGLGLAIAARLVEQSGGSLSYEPNTPKGSQFVARVPMAPAGDAR